MIEKIAIGCARCKSRFKERVERLREGYQGQCPSCGAFINFTSESSDPAIRKALLEARRIRNRVVPSSTGLKNSKSREL